MACISADYSTREMKQVVFRGSQTHGYAECQAIMGVTGQSPQQGPGAEPLVRGQGAKLQFVLKSVFCKTKNLSNVWGHGPLEVPVHQMSKL